MLQISSLLDTLPTLKGYKYLFFVFTPDLDASVGLTGPFVGVDVDKWHKAAHESVCKTMNNLADFVQQFPDHPDPSERVRPIKPENN
jgi:hypothetical protein